MGFPEGVPVVDLMLDVPDEDKPATYRFLDPLLRDRESREEFAFPAQYMFKDVPEEPAGVDLLAMVIEQMDRHGIEQAMVGVSDHDGAGIRPQIRRAFEEHPDRFFGSVSIDPNDGMVAIRQIRDAVDRWPVRSVQVFPAGCNPQVPIDDKRMYPIYATCVELGLPIFVTVGVPGPRVPFACQHVELIDEVCWFFPELTFVMRHGAEPWADLAVKLMLKWPNLHYSTSAFAPRYYPKAIFDYANTRGAERVMYAGYFPMGLSLERIFAELRDVPLRDEVWPLFLHENARRILRLDEPPPGRR